MPPRKNFPSERNQLAGRRAGLDLGRVSGVFAEEGISVNQWGRIGIIKIPQSQNVTRKYEKTILLLHNLGFYIQRIPQIC